MGKRPPPVGRNMYVLCLGVGRGKREINRYPVTAMYAYQLEEMPEMESISISQSVIGHVLPDLLE